jgi:nitrile hydratase accessory protein
LTFGTITLNPPDISAGQSAFEALPDLPRNEGGPLFAEPWQAAAFAVAVSLSRHGHFSWKEWAAALAEELKSSAARGEPDDGTHYYHCWLATLERLVVAKGLSQSAELSRCKEAWADAYRRTPHGKPVELQDPRSES